MASPINLIWNGETFEPANKFWAAKCDQRFVVGQGYAMDQVHQRSLASHGHYFAELNEVHQSLPDHLEEKFPTVEKMRKHALIRTGYCNTTTHSFSGFGDAKTFEAAINHYSKAFRADDYQIVIREGCIVTVYQAMSQDMSSMDKQTFEASKDAVLNWCHSLIGSDRPEQVRASA